jgi:hypothetical protein
MATICSSVKRFFITALSGPRFYRLKLGHFRGAGPHSYSYNYNYHTYLFADGKGGNSGQGLGTGGACGIATATACAVSINTSGNSGVRATAMAVGEFGGGIGGMLTGPGSRTNLADSDSLYSC